MTATAKTGAVPVAFNLCADACPQRFVQPVLPGALLMADDVMSIRLIDQCPVCGRGWATTWDCDTAGAHARLTHAEVVERGLMALREMAAGSSRPVARRLGNGEGVRGVSRVTGRRAIVRTLRLLQVRTHRFGTKRATTVDEQRWAAQLFDRLSAALAEAAEQEVRASVAAADRRAAINRKTAPPATTNLDAGGCA